jgi:hypothetical protein
MDYALEGRDSSPGKEEKFLQITVATLSKA